MDIGGVETMQYVSEMMSTSSSVLKKALNWWSDVNESAIWEDRIFHVLAILYGIVFMEAIVIQLLRIHFKIYCGWTKRNVFRFLNILVSGVRVLQFVFRGNVQNMHPQILQQILLDITSLAFVTTYAILILFWAEIHPQALDGLKFSFWAVNAIVYVVQISLWLVMWWKPVRVMMILSKMFLAGVSLLAALGVSFHGGRIYRFIQLFPLESRFRRERLREVGYVATICFTCFLIRCIMMCFAAFNEGANLDVLNDPIFNFIYYLLVEIIPSSLIIFILRNLPPKRGTRNYRQIS